MIASLPDDLFTRRALGAYKHSCGTVANAMLAMSGGETDTKDRRYVVLRDGSIEICAVYRVRNDGRLKRLKRWPAEVG